MRLKNRVEELEVENKSLWQAIINYETHYRELCDAMKKEIKQQGEVINDLVELCRPMIAERASSTLREINNLIEKELKDLIANEKAKTTPKAEKARKPKAKKTEKVDELKTENKSKKKGNK